MVSRKLHPALGSAVPYLFSSIFLILASFHPAFSSNFSEEWYEYEVTVVDENNQPLIGVNVFTDDKIKVATTTDLDGKAILKDLKYQEEINFTYIGFQSKKLAFYEIRQLGGIITLLPEVEELVEIVVIGRRDDLEEDLPYQIQQISKKDIALTNSQTSADVLRDHGNLFVQKSQMGGGSPIVRGFEANRVLLVLDGVRLNNAIYREGHLQNSLTVDNSMLERVEVIFGPGSLMYGSDALGGVVHFRSKSPKLYFGEAKNGYVLETNAYTRFSSANLESTTHVDLSYGKEKWASLTSLTYSSFDNLKSGSRRPNGYEDFGKRKFYAYRVDDDDQVLASDNPDIQHGTAYSQIDFLQKIKFQPTDNLYFVGNIQYSTTSDIPRYDRLTETVGSDEKLKFAEWFYGPQKRFLTSLKTRIQKPSKLYDKATIIASFQKIDEDRLNRKLHKSKRSFNLEDVFVYALTGDFDKNLDPDGQQQFAYGFDLNHNTVNSTAGKVKMVGETIDRSRLTRYPGVGSRMSSVGAYANYRWRSQDSVLTFQSGLRYSQVSLFSKFDNDSLIIWPEEYINPGVSANNGDLTWGAGLTINTKDKWQIRMLAASAFRSPNIDDFSKIREKNGYVTIPNPSLKPERSWNGELTVGKEFGRIEGGQGTVVKLSGTGFYTYLRDVIVRKAFALPDETNTLTMDGEILETQANVNSESAYIYGASGNLLLKMGSSWKLKSSINFTKGKTRFKKIDNEEIVVADTLVPLAHIPPIYGQTSLTFQKEKFTLSFVARYNGKKTPDDYAITDINLDESNPDILIINKNGSSDNLEKSYSRQDEEGNLIYDGSLAWQTFNFYTSWKLSKKISLDLAVENILDTHYRTFASGISAPGRNFIVTLRGNF